MFKWLGNVNHTKLQDNGITMRSNLTQQTGTWFLESVEFQSWLHKRGSKLWVHGIRMYIVILTAYSKKFTDLKISWLGENRADVWC